MTGIRTSFSLFILLLAQSTFTSFATAEETWEERRVRRCAYYRELVEVAFENIDRAKLGARFLAEHEAFIDGGCFADKAVCPATPAELAFADILTMMTVSANMGSTFTPFRCPTNEEAHKE
ncbi:hypothetical protein [Roseibium sp. M-1]